MWPLLILKSLGLFSPPPVRAFGHHLNEQFPAGGVTSSGLLAPGNTQRNAAPFRNHAYVPGYSFRWREKQGGKEREAQSVEDAHIFPDLVFLECPFYLR